MKIDNKAYERYPVSVGQSIGLFPAINVVLRSQQDFSAMHKRDNLHYIA